MIYTLTRDDIPNLRSNQKVKPKGLDKKIDKRVLVDFLAEKERFELSNYFW